MIRKLILLATALGAAGYAIFRFRRRKVTVPAREWNAKPEADLPFHPDTIEQIGEELHEKREEVAEFPEGDAVFPEGSIEKSQKADPQ